MFERLSLCVRPLARVGSRPPGIYPSFCELYEVVRDFEDDTRHRRHSTVLYRPPACLDEFFTFLADSARASASVSNASFRREQVRRRWEVDEGPAGHVTR